MKKSFGEQVREERERRGLSQIELAAISNTTQQSIDRIERDVVKRSRSMIEVATALDLALPVKTTSNGEVSGSANLNTNFKVPVYGKAIGGIHGQFVLNGNKIDDILAPASLRGVRDAYAVYTSGESMEPRYFAGEALFINPHMPVRRGDFVVAQIAHEESEPPLAYVKRFISLNADTIKLEQFNPHEILEFDAVDVVSVHKIVMSGEG